MGDEPFSGKAPRGDFDESFPANLVDPVGPALISETEPLSAALVAAYLLRDAVRAGGARVKGAAVDAAITALERALVADARRWCEDEARRIAHWCEAPSQEPPEEEGLEGDRAVMATADQRSRLAVIGWAVQQELDVELEWYDEEEDRWPRMRATPIGVDEQEDETVVIVRTSLARIAIPVANLRWVMPVERREQPRPELARVLAFPSAATQQEE